MLLPPHSSHLLQPLDPAVFKSIKNEWDKYYALGVEITGDKNCLSQNPRCLSINL